MKNMTNNKYLTLFGTIPFLLFLFLCARASIYIFSESYAVTLEKKGNLRDMLKRDFGLELEISGGYGQSRDDPIVLLNSNPVEASMIEMHVLRAIGIGRGILWRTLARTPIEHNRLLLEQIKIETKEVTASKVITQRENYYFDISMTAVRGKPLPTAIAFLDNKTKLALPYELGWLHYNEVINNEPTAPGYGQTIAYDAPGAKATAYLYDKKRSDIPSNIEALVVRKEFEAAMSDLMTLHPNATRLGKLSKSKKLLTQTFKIDNDLSIVGLGVFRGKFIKLRITHVHDPLLVEVVNQSIDAFQDILVP